MPRARHRSVATDQIVRQIAVLRGQKIILDADLAKLYGVETRALVQAVKRNAERFPADFMFRVTAQELAALRSQSVISKTQPGRGGRRYPPYAFTEHGALMAATILNSPRAVEMSLYVVRAFVRLRDLIAMNKAFAEKLKELERRIDDHDQVVVEIVQALRELMAPPPAGSKRKIGFV
jgi:hypothetical protein